MPRMPSVPKNCVVMEVPLILQNVDTGAKLECPTASRIIVALPRINIAARPGAPSTVQHSTLQLRHRSGHWQQQGHDVWHPCR